jgi:hypothetical protein
VTSTADHGLGQAAAWRSSAYSTTSHPPACVEAAGGRMTPGGVFIIDPPAAPSPVAVTTTRPPVSHTMRRRASAAYTPGGYLTSNPIEQRTHDVISTSPPQLGDAQTIFRTRGGAGGLDGDIVGDWETESGLPWFRSPTGRRNPALRDIDQAVRRWRDGARDTPDDLAQNENELREILTAIDRWRDVKGGISNRNAAVTRLEQRIWDELGAVVDKRHTVTGLGPMGASAHGATSVAGDDEVAVSQRMVPSGRDLILARNLLDPAVADPYAAELAEVDRALSATPEGDAAREPLRQRRENLLEDQSIFNAMRGRADWSQLDPVQAAALVLAERRGRAIEAESRQALIEKLRDGHWEWATKYPLDDDHVDEFIDQVHDFMQHQMILTINVPLAKLKLLTADVENLLKTGWETDQTNTYLNMRGNVEEWLGYAASVKRDIEAGGIYPPNPATSGSKRHFSPNEQDRKQLPKYAALISPLRQAGLSRYGEVAFHLKPELRNRATFTPYDSFAPDLKGARGVTSRSNLIPLLVHGSDNMVRATFAEATKFAYDFSETLARSIGATYFEAQIHGNVSWKNVDKIVLSHYVAATNTATQNTLEEFAASNGLTFTVEINQRENAYQSRGGKTHVFDPGPEETRVDLAPELKNWQIWSSALGVDVVPSASAQQRPSGDSHSGEAVGIDGFQQNEPRTPRPESGSGLPHSVEEWLGVRVGSGLTAAIEEVDALVSAAGSPALALTALVWNESSHSLPPDPNDENAEKACVSVAVVDLDSEMGR